MPFEVIWAKKAKNSLKALDKAAARRIVDKVESLAGRETVFLEKVKGKDFYKYRVGRYRVFIDKFPATKKLVVLLVRHRKKAYKNI